MPDGAGLKARNYIDAEIGRHVPSLEVRDGPVHGAPGLLHARGPLVAGPSLGVAHDAHARRRCRQRELVATEFGQPHAGERQVAGVVAGAHGRRAEPPIGVVRHQQREVLAGQIVGGIDAVGPAPRDDLPARAQVETPEAYIHERLAHFARRVAVLERPAQRRPPFGQERHTARQPPRRLQPQHPRADMPLVVEVPRRAPVAGAHRTGHAETLEDSRRRHLGHRDLLRSRRCGEGHRNRNHPPGAHHRPLNRFR